MIEKELLLEIQHNFPLCRFPFAELAKRVGANEDEVIEILQKNKNEKIIRQTSAIFDTKKLGYKSSLVALEVDPSELETAVFNINKHPGVSHNYLRQHKFNLWFTIAIAPDSKFSLESSVQYLAKKANVTNYLILPTLKMFKISVKLDTTSSGAKKEEIKQKSCKEITLNELHFRVIEVLQSDLKFEKEPFLHMIEKLAIGYDEFFDYLKELQESGVMRRFASILNHKKAGFGANAMVVWEVGEDVAKYGQIAAGFSFVSHCYQRPVFENWKYNLFTMMHATSDEELESFIEMAANEIKHDSKEILTSLKEFKKVRIVYFSEEFGKYENEVSDEFFGA